MVHVREAVVAFYIARFKSLEFACITGGKHDTCFNLCIQFVP